MKESMPGRIEKIDRWRELQLEARPKAQAKLEEEHFPLKLNDASIEVLDAALGRLSHLIDELSIDHETGHVKNENRYLVRELTVYQNKLQRWFEYKSAPTPDFLEAA